MQMQMESVRASSNQVPILCRVNCLNMVRLACGVWVASLAGLGGVGGGPGFGVALSKKQ